jgi:hypothetical protein
VQTSACTRTGFGNVNENWCSRASSRKEIQAAKWRIVQQDSCGIKGMGQGSSKDA